MLVAPSRFWKQGATAAAAVIGAIVVGVAQSSKLGVMVVAVVAVVVERREVQ